MKTGIKLVIPTLTLVGCMIVIGCAAPAQSNVISAPQDPKTKSPPATSKVDDKTKPKYANPAMLDPTKATEKAPDTFRAKLVTSKGDIVIEVNRKWSPNGADRFYNLVKIGYFKDVLVFRAIKGFMFQFGIHADPAVNAEWGNSNIKDDPPAGISNQKGFITFAKTGAPNSRSTQMFINFGDNGGLDNQGFTPFGKVVEGMAVLEKINTEYGENRIFNFQGDFQAKGNPYALSKYPNLDMIKSATIIK